MIKIYVNQSAKLNLSTNVTLNAADEIYIKYKKPDESQGEWPATFLDDNNVFYEIPKNTLDIPGRWRFWISLVPNGTNEWYPGEFQEITVYTEGS